MDPFLGMIMLWSGPRIPVNWVLCDGRTLPIQGNEALYSLIGVTFGGDGRTNFAVPDLRSKVPIGIGHGTNLSTYVLGAQGGVETVTLTQANIPAHTHVAAIDTPVVNINASLAVSSTQSNEAAVSGTTDMLGAGYAPGGGTPFDVYNYGPVASMTNLTNAVKLSTAGSPVTVGATGTGGSHSNIQPVLPLNYLIATQGFYPEQQ